MTDGVSFVTYWDTWVGLFNSTVHTETPDSPFQAVGIAATEGPEGVIITRGTPSVWTVPVNAKSPDLAFKFTEWWNTIPGITLGSLGILDNDYTVTDGKVEITEIGKEHNMDHGDPTPYSSHWVNPIGTLPGLKGGAGDHQGARLPRYPQRGLVAGRSRPIPGSVHHPGDPRRHLAKDPSPRCRTSFRPAASRLGGGTARHQRTRAPAPGSHTSRLTPWEPPRPCAPPSA